MAPLFRFSWDRIYFCLFAIALCTVLGTALFTRVDAVIPSRGWGFMAAGFAVAYAAIITPFLARGTTIRAFLYVTIFQHKDFTHHWFRATDLGIGTVFCSVCSLALFLTWLNNKNRARNQQSYLSALQILKLVLALLVAYLLLCRPMNWPLGVIIMAYVAPFTWLVLLPPPGENAQSTRFARIAIAILSVFVNLYAFPVAGSQSLFAVLPLVPVIAICLYDGLVFLSLRSASLSYFWPKLAAAALATLLIAYTYLHSARYFRYLYTGTPSLALPGAARIHDYPNRVKTFQWLAQQIDARCSSFFSMPGLFSLYFWTKQDSPTLMMMNDWPGFLSSSQQQVVIRDLSDRNTACVVYDPALVSFFHASAAIPSSPLAHYIQSEFVTVDRRDGYEFMVRKAPFSRSVNLPAK